MRPSLIVQWPLCHGFTFHSSSELPSARGLKPADCSCSAVIWPGILASAANDEHTHGMLKVISKAMGRCRCIIRPRFGCNLVRIKCMQTGMSAPRWSYYFRYAGDRDRVAAITIGLHGGLGVPFLGVGRHHH